MNNFNFQNPVRIIFGKDTIKEISSVIPKGKKVLMIYGGGSIKSNGVYEQAVKALKGIEFIEFSGIEPNPHYETCMKAVEIIKANDIGFLLAVGGGSVIDGTKFISAAAHFSGKDAWEILSKGADIKEAVPFGTILTLPATGSEMNSGAVITRAATKEKFSFNSPLVFPQFSVLDPTVTYSLPETQISNGIVDSFVHVMEQYCTYQNGSMLQNMFAESIMKTLISEGPKAFEDPTNYDVRANLMWASTWALNKWIACGVPEDWSTHMIGHELTALYGLDHAQTLAIVLLGVLTVMQEQKRDMILQLGEQVFGIYNNLTTDERVQYTIEAVEGFFHEVKVKTRLSDYGLGKEAVEAVAERIEKRGWKLGEHHNITGKEVREILMLRL